ncbi:MAG TPA: sigma-70 family RNA polymerase sigma factor [Candidatus Acidoferrales bacterium]|nr:sigma-70 family RNA polymerase sigma factor [Candidatus Acidoferrales bacterium]
MAAPSEDELANGFAAHERWAFDEAYRRYSGLLYSAAYNVLGNAEDARDCVHDALSRVWRSPHAYTRARGAVRSFLVVCVRNEAISRRRSQSRRARLNERLAAEPVVHAELGAGDPIERDRLRAALAQLPPEQRVPLELAYYRGKTHVEIASELQQPLGTIKSRIAMGLRKLGAALGGTPA